RGEEAVSRAVEEFNQAEPPRFMWIHLFDSHRPYGHDDEAIPDSLDRKAEFASPESFWSSGLSDKEAELLEEKYRASLRRVDSQLKKLFDEIDSDPIYVITADHGEELGEGGYYYHQGWRRRLPETVTNVPSVFGGFELEAEQMSHLDIAPTILGRLGIDIPEEWHGKNLIEESRDQALTIAPWNNKASVLWQDFDTRILMEDADISLSQHGSVIEPEKTEVDERTRKRLRDLGYIDSG
ncbi:MAG: sulfatase-like hydrolase/transferase, partial [Candidatus Nanohaloarchaea archaeon]|nr:sulfatase-like hydrolase/transferase [Candidatus Nanohaloarchaea archaeon]